MTRHIFQDFLKIMLHKNSLTLYC